MEEKRRLQSQIRDALDIMRLSMRFLETIKTNEQGARHASSIATKEADFDNAVLGIQTLIIRYKDS